MTTKEIIERLETIFAESQAMLVQTENLHEHLESLPPDEATEEYERLLLRYERVDEDLASIQSEIMHGAAEEILRRAAS